MILRSHTLDYDVIIHVYHTTFIISRQKSGKKISCKRQLHSNRTTLRYKTVVLYYYYYEPVQRIPAVVVLSVEPYTFLSPSWS